MYEEEHVLELGGKGGMNGLCGIVGCIWLGRLKWLLVREETSLLQEACVYGVGVKAWKGCLPEN